MNKPSDADACHELLSPYMKMPDAENGELSAEARLRRLMTEHERPLYGFLVLLVMDSSLAQDCVQDTFVRAYQQLEKGTSINRQWLYKVARNRGLDELRRHRKARAAEDELNAISVPEPQEDVRSARVRRALEQLATQDRELLYLSDVDGLRAEAIGDILGLRPGAVRMRLCRAHKRFRAIYGDSP